MASANAQNDTESEMEGYDAIPLAGEPILGWEKATHTWGSAWYTLVYSALAINAIMLVWAVMNIILTLRIKRLLSRSYFLTLNVMVMIFSLSRILFYSIDPYSIRKVMPVLISNLLNNLTFPTLSVGFFLLYTALKQCVLPSNGLMPVLLKARSIVLFSGTCFLISILTDTLVYFVHSASLMILVCQIFYVLWAFIFLGLFISLIWQFRRFINRSKLKMSKSCYRVGHCRSDFRQRHIVALPTCVHISCISGVFMLMLAAVNIYMIVVEFGLMKKSMLTKLCYQLRQIWPFFILRVIELVIEHLLALTLVICGAQPVKRLQVKKISNRTTITSEPLSHVRHSLANTCTSDSVFYHTTHYDSVVPQLNHDTISTIPIEESPS